jgi:hypothetical protein
VIGSSVGRRRLGVSLVLFLIGCTSKDAESDLVGGTSNPPESDLGARLKEHVTQLTDIRPPRNHENPESLQRVASYIQDKFEAAGLAVREQPFQVGSQTFTNVTGLLGSETSDRVVIGAHYDVSGPHPGADDNASGVAVLIELADQLKGEKVERAIELVAYCLEEPPFFGSADMGSAHHARDLQKRGVSVRAMISLEMVGYFSDEEGRQKFPMPEMRERYPSKGNFIAVIG